MSTDFVATAFATLEEPIRPRPEFAAELFARLEAELVGTPAPPVEPATPGRLAQRRRMRWRVGLGAAAAAAVVAIVSTLVVLLPRPDSALAVITAARSHFAELPPVHVVYTERTNGDGKPGREQVETTDVWFAGPDRWRATVTAAANLSDHPGDFRVTDGSLEGTFTQDPDVFSVQRLSDVDEPVLQSGIGALSPQAVWDESRHVGIPPEEWFKNYCSAKSTTLLGREASLLTCSQENLRLWIDTQTGLVLKQSDPDFVRVVDSLEVSPSFAAGLFEVSAPQGAKVRWDGGLPVPPAYAAEPDGRVSATVRLGGATPYFLAATPDGVWVASQVTPSSSDPLLLQRIDPTANRVVTTLRIHDNIAALFYADGTLWESSVYDGGSWVRPLDPVTGRALGPRTVVEPAGGFMGSLAFESGHLWFSGGTQRTVGAGLNAQQYNALARIDVATMRTQQFRLPGTAGGLATGFGSVWVEASPLWAGDGKNETVLRLDPSSGRVLARFPVGDQPPTFLVAGDRYMYISPPVDEAHRVVEVIDPDTNTVIAKRTRPLGGLEFAAGRLWMTNGMDDSVQALDPRTLRVEQTVRVGRLPYHVAFAAGSLWSLSYEDNTVSRITIGP